jgi:hypothetical protein
MNARIAAAVVLLAALRSAEADAPPKPAEGFAKIQDVAARAADEPEATASDLAAMFPADLVESRFPWSPGRTVEWRKAFAARLGRAKVIGIRGAGDKAIVRIAGRDAGEEAELPIQRAGDRWSVAASEEHVVKGKALDGANGRKPAKLRLTARTTNGPYGGSAFSFAHVTSDPEKSKNRMDVWYCHNGDLHAAADCEVAEAGKLSLDKIASIPLEAKWSDHVTPAKGSSYVIHCYRKGKRDFFVKLKVTALSAQAIEMDWQILGTGFASPAGIHEPQPWTRPPGNEGEEGADGADGLCGKNG